MSLIFKVPLERLWQPYLLFLAPTLAGLPLMFYARRFRGRPKVCAFWSALGLAVQITLLGIASFYSGVMDWMLPGVSSGPETIFFVAFGIVFGSLFGYTMYERLTAGKF